MKRSSTFLFLASLRLCGFALVLLFAGALQCHGQRFVKYVDSVQELKNLNVADVHGSVFVRGYYAANDGGEGFFFWHSTDTTATNRGTILKGKTTGAELATGRWNRVFQNGDLNVRWFGAKGDGTTSDTAAFQDAQAALSTNRNGIIRAQDGKFKINFVVTNQSLTLIGNSHRIDATQTTLNCFIPDNNALPVVQVGNDTARTKGFKMVDCAVNGNSVGSIGLYLYGGPFESTIDNCTFQYFTNGVKVLGGPTNATSLVWFKRCDIQAANVVGARGFLLQQTTNYPTSWTTAIYLNDCHIQGPSTASDSYIAEFDSASIYISSSYMEGYDDHGIKISKSQAQSPFLYMVNTAIETNPGTGAAVESYNNNRYFGDQIKGFFTIFGKWKLLDGTLMNPPQGGSSTAYHSLLFPNIQDHLSIVPLNATDFDGWDYTNNRIGMAGGNLFITTSGTLKINSATGIAQVDGAPSTGLSQFNLYDLPNNKTVSMHGINGFMRLRAAAGGGVQLQSADGLTTGLQVNGTGAGLFFLGLSSGLNIPYLDSNKQVQPSPVLTVDAGGQVTADRVKTIGTWTNNAATERAVQTLSLSGTNYTVSWTNNPMQFRINLSADSGLVEANTTGTNRDMTIFVYGDNTHFLALPSGWRLNGGSTNQPFPNGRTVLWVERLDGTNYLDTSVAVTSSLADNSVTDAKLRDSAALSVIGRSANSSGDPADIVAANDGEVLRRSGTSVGFGTIATAGIANDAVDNTKLANMANATIKGRNTAGTGDPEDLTALPNGVQDNITRLGTVNSGTLKFREGLPFIYAHRVAAATNVTIVTNDITSGLSGLASMAGAGSTNSNFAIYRVGFWPNDIDTAAAVKLRNFSIRVTGTDTDAVEYTIALFAPASSGGYSPSDFTACSTFINFDSGTLTSPAAEDGFFCADVTLTGWGAALTAGRPIVIGIARRDGNNDDQVTILGGTIEYGLSKALQ